MDSQRTAFGTVLFGGFRKDAVYQYIEQLVMDHETTCKRYEHQKTDLELKLAEALKKQEELSVECEKLRGEKEMLEREISEREAEKE